MKATQKEVKTVRTTGGKNLAAGNNISPITKLIAKRTKKENMSEEARGQLIKAMKRFISGLASDTALCAELFGKRKVIMNKEVLKIIIGLKHPQLLVKEKQ